MPHQQAALCCTLPGFDRRKWDPRANPRGLPVVYMGAPPDYAHSDGGNWDKPLEPIATDGCPGGWYRTPFVESVLRYARRGNGEGGRVPNRLLDTCTDELVAEAVERLEGYEDHWRSERQAAQIDRMNREAAKRD